MLAVYKYCEMLLLDYFKKQVFLQSHLTKLDHFVKLYCRLLSERPTCAHLKHCKCWESIMRVADDEGEIIGKYILQNMEL